MTETSGQSVFSILNDKLRIWKAREYFKYELAAALVMAVLVVGGGIVLVIRAQEKRAICTREISYTSDHRYYYLHMGESKFFGTHAEAMNFCLKFRYFSNL